MQFGDVDYPIGQFVVLIALILSIVFTTLLFFRGHSSYSVKYELMRNHQYFRVNKWATQTVEYLYKTFFVLPIALIITIAVLRGIKDWRQIIGILINGMVILSVLYPIKNQYFFYKLFLGWTLVIASQISTLFLYLKDNEELYMELSLIFYGINFILFSLAILANQGVYWEISEEVAKFPQKIKQVNQKWSQDVKNIPKVFDGGLYGAFCKSQFSTYSIFTALYLSSLCVLGLYAFLVWLIDNSYLGVIGLISNIVYDLFVIVFSSLREKERSIRSIFLVIFFGRLMSFIFGSSLWLIGYCVLYLGIGIFVGSLIVDRRLPMKLQSAQQQLEARNVNAIKTPQFVLFLLTVDIIALVGTSYGLKLSPTLEHNGQELPLWQIGLLSVFVTWIIITYMFSIRVLARYMNKITGSVNYFFGLQFISEYHIYTSVTYVMINAVGVYWYLYFGDAIVIIGCIFLPLIYLSILTIFTEWVTNEYQILADIDDYNKKARKKHNIQIKKEEVIYKRKERQSKNKSNNFQTLGRFNQIHNTGNLNSNNTNFNNIIRVRQDESQMTRLNPTYSLVNQQSSNLEGMHSEQPMTNQKNIEFNYNILSFESKISPFEELKDWKDPKNNVPWNQVWFHLTPSDKKIVVSFVLLLLLLVGLSLCGYLWAKTDVGLSFSLSLVCYITMLTYYRCAKCGSEILIGELIGSTLGFLLGLIYWSILYDYIVGPIIWGVIFIGIAGLLIGIGVKKKLETKIKLFLVIKIVLTLALICIILGVSFQPSVIIVTATIIVLIGLSMIGLYFRIKTEVVPIWTSILIISAVVGGILTLAILGFIFGIVGALAVFTIVLGLIWLGLLIGSLVIYIQKHNNRFQNPNVYSSYGYPIYRFESAKEQLKSSTNHLVIFSIAMVVLIVYTVLVAIIFSEKQFSIYSSALFICIQFFVVISTSITSYYNIGLRRRYLTDELVLQAYEELIQKYMLDETEGDDSSHYRDLQNQKKEIVEKRDYQNDDELNKLWKDIVYNHDLMVQNEEEEEKFLFYWIVLIDYHLQAKKRQFIITSLNQIKEIQQQLINDGILLQHLNQSLPPQTKFKKVMKELDSLPPLDYVIYQQILHAHKEQRSLKKVQLDKLGKIQDKKNDLRDDQLFKKISVIKSDKRDEIKKFNELIESLNRKGLYTDDEFPPNEKSLGLLASKVDAWRRPYVRETFIKDGIDAGDVKQGDIGDCYLISSFGVLGEKRIRSALGWDGENQLWKNSKGAYMVRFYKFLKEVYVTIDDNMPVDMQEEWVFAKSEDAEQFWPGILEKAYAKLYSGYQNIIEGKCHRVLAQFTGGFPFEIVLQTYKNNPNGLWAKIMSGKSNGYLLAGGTPSNPQGDQAVSKRGIVQGHAYSVLDAREVENHKVMKLKNPHGSGGRQWIGDFSDSSDLMTKRMMGLLEHSQKEDGIFWMPLEDFIYEFKSLYICAVFDDGWKKIDPIQGEWTPQNSYGTPNLSPDTYLNPQYGLTVKQKSTLFINLTQEAVSALKGKNYIYLRVQRNDGVRMHKEDICSSKLCGTPLRPINAVSLSTEIELQADRYPYTFTILVSTKAEGETGKYTLEIYCSDLAAQLIDDSKFDR